MSDLDGPVLAGGVIGIFGGGQLGRMLSLAAARLGLRCHIFCQHRDEPAAQVTPLVTCGAFDDLQAIRAFAATCDVVTIEFENVPVAALEAAAEVVPVAPGPRALEVAQDRLAEKTFVADLGVPVAPFAVVDGSDPVRGLMAAWHEIGGPGILKTRRLGYDGLGQFRLSADVDRGTAAAAIDAIGAVPAIVEGLVEFNYEVSVLLVRDRAGTVATYDLPLNEHRDGILAQSSVPSPASPDTTAAAIQHAATIADALDYVGVLAVEFFVLRDGALVVNEIAPRVHNSGHWTIDACLVSQFENHMRAVAGWPLGSTERHSDAIMTNRIGHPVSGWDPPLATSAVHDYGKAEARPGRKMGHLTELEGPAGPPIR